MFKDFCQKRPDVGSRTSQVHVHVCACMFLRVDARACIHGCVYVYEHAHVNEDMQGQICVCVRHVTTTDGPTNISYHKHINNVARLFN